MGKGVLARLVAGHRVESVSNFPSGRVVRENMGRKPKIDYQELKERILQLAMETVAKEGVTGLSTRKIAKQIGCAHGTIYNVFENLDAIILQINGLSLDRLHKQLEQDVAGIGDPQVAVSQLAKTYTDYCHRHYHLWSMLVDHKLAQGNTIPAWYQDKIDALFLLVSKMILPLVADEKERAERAARVLWASLHGVCSLAMDGKLNVIHSDSAEVLADSLVRNYLKGLTQGG